MRPNTLDSVIGNVEVVNRLRIHVSATKLAGEVFPHTMFTGPAGLGKTTLAQALANELGVSFHSVNAAAVSSVKEFSNLVVESADGVLFIDEVHRLRTKMQELLYPALEDRYIQAQSKLFRGLQITVPLPGFTLIAATTDEGLLSKPFRDRILIKERLVEYSPEEIALIVEANCRHYGLSISRDDALTVARTCRGTPRIAVNRTKWLRNMALCDGLTRVDRPLIHKALVAEGVTHDGYDKQDGAYLSALVRKFKGGPASLKSIAAAADINETTAQEVVEPFLLKNGIINICSRGRHLTQVGVDFYKSRMVKR